MMGYSLETVLYLLRTRFASFFQNISVDKTKMEYSCRWVNDEDNKIISIHHFNWGKETEDELKLLRLKTKERYKYLNFAMKMSRKILFISNRDIDIKTAIHFLKSIYKIYRKDITYINIINTNNLIEKETNEIKITRKLKYIEIQFNDIHHKGNDRKTNKDFWLGNIYEWENLIKKINLTKYSVIIFALIKIMKAAKKIMSKNRA